MKRVVITGLGVVTPIGCNVKDFSCSLREGRCGISDISKFDTKSFPVKRAFEVKNFKPACSHLKPDPFIDYGLSAACEALSDACFDTASVDPFCVGVVVSSSKGGVTTLETLLKDSSGAGELYAYVAPDAAARAVARKFKIKGPVRNYIAACATGTVSIIEGIRMVARGDVDYCLAGATDASITPVILAGYHKMGIYSCNGMHPFDARRSGFVIGEGAGCVFLESRESAHRRGARIYGEILGTANGQDAYHPVRFHPNGGTLSSLLRKLCQQSKIEPREIDYFNTHGTATREGDIYETQEIKKAFGRDAYQIPYSSTKSMVGHMLGAAGAVEFITCLIAINGGFVPPTAGLEELDTDCDLDYTPNNSRKKEIAVACSVSMAFGGHVAGIMVKKCGS